MKLVAVKFRNCENAKYRENEIKLEFQKVRTANSKINRRKSRARFPSKNFTIRYDIGCIIYCHVGSASTLECASFVPVSKMFDEKFPKRFLCKRRDRSAKGAANRDHSGRIVADPAAIPYLRYNILYHVEYLYVFILKFYYLFAAPLHRNSHVLHRCLAHSATNSSRIIIMDVRIYRWDILCGKGDNSSKGVIP